MRRINLLFLIYYRFVYKNMILYIYIIERKLSMKETRISFFPGAKIASGGGVFKTK